MLAQRGEDGLGMIVERPGLGARISEFDETDMIPDSGAKTADEGPIAVQTGQIDQRWPIRLAVNADL